MRSCLFTCVTMFAAVPASAQMPVPQVDLLPGHPIYHEEEQEAGVAMALTIIPDRGEAASSELCEELRVAAGLGEENADGISLQTIFVVPYKGMAVEGYYLPSDDLVGTGTLMSGNAVPRATLDRILERAGIPARVLDETGVEQEISCSPGEPWSITWSDVRPIGDQQPETVIERARDRFLAIHQSVVEHATRERLEEAQRSFHDG